jgi:Holliday junction resolvase
MRERDVERRLVKAVKDAGGWAVKLACPGTDGMPDRMVLMGGGRIAFVEVKAPGEKPRPLQLRRHEQLRALGFKVYVIDGTEQIASVVAEVSGEGGDAR